MPGNHQSLSTSSPPKHHRRNIGFYANYQDMCKKRNVQPLFDIKEKCILDFFTDRVKLDDWPSIIKALTSDESLHYIAIRSRKTYPHVLEKLDTDKKCRANKTEPPIIFKFIFSALIESISNSLTINSSVTTLFLEGLPLIGMYMQSLTKGIAQNTSLKSISFARTNMADEGCATFCATIKHLPHVESINLSHCQLTSKGAEYVSGLLQYQKIVRYSEGWKKSLRYQEVDPSSIPGLRHVALSHNCEIGDEGLSALVAVLADDVWITGIEMKNCGLSDVSAGAIIDCINLNKTIVVFDIRDNEQLSEQMANCVRRKLGIFDTVAVKVTAKAEAAAAKERVLFLEQQLEMEAYNRRQVEVLNEQLHKQLMEFHKDICMREEYPVPQGYCLVVKETLDELLEELEHYRQSATVATPENSGILEQNSSPIKISTARRAKSEQLPIDSNHRPSMSKYSKSECSKVGARERNPTSRRVYVEKGMGDYAQPQKHIAEPNCSKKPPPPPVWNDKPIRRQEYESVVSFFGCNNTNVLQDEMESDNSRSSDEDADIDDGQFYS